ncbi:hypothetical protein LOK49_LG10G00880 [Camellia lanceoleosa]|uniref:Uncharacterized protein n=1 Tax=Camellia lanceoleosa TaxID=1840588 RepID=A0ACC0G962_9ERIC|nr:hypothetical protein LOK49_LG10G00880 [Camellia lanceoleosa]
MMGPEWIEERNEMLIKKEVDLPYLLLFKLPMKERKVFGSRGQILKDELVGRHQENRNRNGKHLGLKLVHSFNSRVNVFYDLFLHNLRIITIFHPFLLDRDLLLEMH